MKQHLPLIVSKHPYRASQELSRGGFGNAAIVLDPLASIGHESDLVREQLRPKILHRNAGRRLGLQLGDDLILRKDPPRASEFLKFIGQHRRYDLGIFSNRSFEELLFAAAQRLSD